MRLVTPVEPVGRKSEHGVVVSSAPDGFEIELAGQKLQPLATDQLLWDIDGLRIELLLLRRPADPAWSASSAIREIAAATGAKNIEPVDFAAGAAPRAPGGGGVPVLVVTATGREAEDLVAALRCLLPPDSVDVPLNVRLPVP